MKIENFKEKLVSLCEKEYHAQPRELTANQLHCAVSKLVMDELSPVWDKSRTAHDKARKASYLSMEFLVGRAIYNNLLCLGILDSTAEELKALGVDISEFEEVEDAALGNGGLGRLAACFLDSAATLDLPLDGYGIRYKYGLFKQGIKDGLQTETARDSRRELRSHRRQRSVSQPFPAHDERSTLSPIRMVKRRSASTASVSSTFSMTRCSGFMVVSQSCSGFISPRPLYL